LNAVVAVIVMLCIHVSECLHCTVRSYLLDVHCGFHNNWSMSSAAHHDLIVPHAHPRLMWYGQWQCVFAYLLTLLFPAWSHGTYYHISDCRRVQQQTENIYMSEHLASVYI